MKTQHFFTSCAVVTALAGLSSGAAMAQQNTIKLGVASVHPNSSASDVRGPFTPSGISLNVENVTTPVFGYERAFDDNWSVEFALGAPPTHDVTLKVNNTAIPGSAQALNGQVGARVRQVAPTVLINYRFLDGSSAIRPFIGAGINYTRFDKTQSTTNGNVLNGGATSLSLEDSVGLALQVGASYRLTKEWSLNAALATAQVKTKLTTNTLGIVRTADIKFRPAVLSLTVGYSF